MATVTFDHVFKRFPGDVVAVDDLSIDVADGEFLVLVGPSGCGKTTALRCVAGLETIDGGRILIGDRVINRLAPKDRDTAMVFQSYALYPHMSVFDNLAFALKLRKRPKAEIQTAVQTTADALGIERLLERKPRALSGGQRQRVALGRAIIREPKVFLMDEPLSNLDAKLRVQTRAEILRLHRRLKTTMIYVTHDQVEAMTMGDRIAVMQAGVLQQIGTPQDLYARPANSFVAGFIGSPAMNFTTVRTSADGLMLGDLRLPLSGAPREAAARLSIGSEVVLGFRPEHLDIATKDGDEGITFPATVDVVEFLGNEELIHAKTEGHEFLALLSSDRHVQAGDRVGLAVRNERLYLFDQASGESLIH